MPGMLLLGEERPGLGLRSFRITLVRDSGNVTWTGPRVLGRPADIEVL